MAELTLTDLLDESNWLEWRARVEHLPAIRWTEMVTTEQTRAEFVEGARLLRLDHKVRSGDGGTGPTPIQLAIADVLNAGTFLNGVMEPRRTTKTTSIQAVLLGRCVYREDYQVGWTMLTTGVKAGERFRKDIVAPIERLYPDPKTRPMTINLSKGSEHLAFPNGSFLNVYTPNGEGFRSGGFDAAFADEGGEAEPDLSEDIILAVLPTMDTKPGAQFIVAGTGAKFRAGNLLWDTLNDESAASIWHGIPETTDPAQLEAWEPDEAHPAARMRELIELHHPGVGYTTPIEAVQRNFEKFPRDKFLLEYGGMFGTEGAADVLIPPAWWERAALDMPMPDVPARFSAALKVHHMGYGATLAVAWELEAPRDLVSEALALDGQETDQPKLRAVGIWYYQRGTDKLVTEVLTRLRRRRTDLVFDDHGHTAVVAGKLAKARPAPKLIGTKPRDIPLATVKMLQGLEDGTVVHFRQPELDRAAGTAVKQAFGQYGTFRFGAPKSDPDADMTPIEAAALALHFLDQHTTDNTRPEDAFEF